MEKHLVISIGKNFYVALAKGPINEFHVLIMSITHISASALLTEDDWQELSKFKQALRDFFKEQEQVVCFTERHYKSSHLQINVLGIDEGYAWKIQHAFEVRFYLIVKFMNPYSIVIHISSYLGIRIEPSQNHIRSLLLKIGRKFKKSLISRFYPYSCTVLFVERIKYYSHKMCR